MFKLDKGAAPPYNPPRWPSANNHFPITYSLTFLKCPHIAQISW